MTKKLTGKILLLCVTPAFLWAGKDVSTQKGEVLPASRSSVTPSRLVFPYATTAAGFDTEITLSNTSLDTQGSTPQAGTCTLNFYGSLSLSPATTNSIAAGKQLDFLLSQGGGGVPAVPSNFTGYIAASCGFPVARGTAKVTAQGHLSFSQDAQVVSLPRSTATPQRLLFPFITNQAGYDSGIAISNTSADPFGTTSVSNSCTLNFYGASAPAPVNTGTITAGSVYLTIASLLAPGFQGYVIATCNFPDAAAVAFVSDLGARNLAHAESPEVVTTPRSTTPQPLLFSSATNQNGLDTGITIANTTADPFGTTTAPGTCTLNFYGANAPAAFTTPTIGAGSVYANLVSVMAPNFQGYIYAVCTFPQSRGWSFTTNVGGTADGDSETAEVVSTPRNTTAAPLLFTEVSNWTGQDTNITISNTSLDASGTASSSGTCNINYFGDMLGGGSVPSPQTSSSIAAGSQLSFSLSQGNSGLGIAGAPGFRGYIIAACTFPLARGVATVTTSTLNVAVTQANFIQGATTATYTITVSNPAGNPASNGTVTVTEILPGLFTLVSMTGASGSGWTCNGASCTRADTLSAGASYPVITVTVSVPQNATSAPQVNGVVVSGGGFATGGVATNTVVAAQNLPTISSVFNAASLVGGGVAPGEIATVFGTNLSPSSKLCVSSGSNAPTTCNTTSILINGIAVPLLFVSPGQVNFVIPFGITGKTASMKAGNLAGQSSAIVLNVVSASPAFFTANGNGQFLSSSFQLISASNLAHPGDIITGYGVAWGLVNPAIGDGVSTPGSPLYHTAATVSLTVGGVPAAVSFAGLGPGLIATYQVNFTVPAGLSGNQPVVLTVDGISSPPVTLPIATVNQSPLTITSGPNLGAFPLGEDQIALTATGGNGGYLWAYVSGTLPPGLSLRTDVPSFFPAGATAGLIGIATTPGTYNFTLSVTSGANTNQQAFSVKITGLNLKDGYNLPDAFLGVAYYNTGYQLTAVNGSGTPVNVTWTYQNGLPAGMTLSATGLISGTPTQTGNFNIAFNFTDGTDTVFRGVGLFVSTVQLTSPGVLPNATQGVAYNYTLTANGGTPPYTFFVGGLPNGLSVNSSTGAITGTPNSGSTKQSLYVTVTDHNNISYNTAHISLFVVATPENLPILVPYGNLDDCAIGVACTRGIGVYGGGVPPLSYAVTGLPPGMDFRSGYGVTSSFVTAGELELWGVPQSLGTYNVTVTMTDGNGLITTNIFPLKVSQIWLDNFLPNGTVGVPYSATFRLVGGTPPYTVTEIPNRNPPATLPAGTSLLGMTVSGTPLEGGGFDPLFQFSDSAGTANTLTLSQYPFFNGVAGTSININSYNTLYASLNQPFSFSLFAGGAASLTWTSSGTLPHNITLSSGGQLSGTPDTAGTYTFLVQATQTGVPSNFGTRQITMVVTPLVITSALTLPFGNVSSAYGQTLTASGGTGALTWALGPGTYLPPGLSLNPASGAISGAPTAPGRTSFSVTVSDTAGHVNFANLNLSIYPAGGNPQLFISTAPGFGTYSIGEIQLALVAGGGLGSGTYTWSVIAGSLPPGLALRTDNPSFFPSNASAGIMGIATTPNATAGTSYSFTLQVTSGNQTVSQACTLRITGMTAMENNFYRLPDAFVGQTPAYSYQLTPLNNAGTVAWTAVTGMPAGLTLSPTGLVSGTPTQAGNFNVHYQMNDGVDNLFQNTQWFNIQVFAVQVTSTGFLPNATQGAVYNPYTVTVSGGTGPYTFTANGLPGGLSINSTTGVISGTDTGGPGSYGVNVTATDVNHTSYTRNLAINVVGVPPTLAFVEVINLDDCTIGMACGRQLAIINGGTAPFTWNVTGLPSGMNFRPSTAGPTQAGVFPLNIELYGVPLQTGAFNITATVTDAGGAIAKATYPLNVSQMFVDGADLLPGGTRGAAYSKVLRVLGGSGPYTVTQVLPQYFPLPAGLTLNGMTVSGTPLENGTLSPYFQYADSASHTLQIHENVGIGEGSSTIYLGQNKFGYEGGTGFYNGLIGYYAVGQTLNYTPFMTGATSYTFSLTSGTLPPGINLATGGNLSGTFTTAGTYTFLLTGADPNNLSNFGARQYTIIVSSLNITTGGALPFGNGPTTPYSFNLISTLPATFSLVSGNFLPPGLTLDANGLIHGTPTVNGQFYFYVQAVDNSNANNIFLKQFSISIYPDGAFPPLFLGTGPNLGTFRLSSRNFQLAASGGNPPYHYSYTPGSPTVPGFRVQDGAPYPSGFSQTTVNNGGTGDFIGFLSAAGTWNTSLRVTDNNGTTYDRAISITATSLNILTPGNPPNAVVNVPYSFAFQGYGGTPPYTWSATTLPAGLTIDPASGTVSGTPTGTGSGATIKIADSTGVSVSLGYTINVDVFAVGPTNNVLPQGVIGTAYNQTLAAPACGTGCVWSITSNSLPGGLSLNANTGAITGTPTGFSNSSFTVRVVGSNGTVSRRFSLLVPFNTPQPLFISTTSPIGYIFVGNTFSQAFIAQGGTPPYTWSVASGSTLPPGLSLQTPGETIGSLYNPGFTYLAGRVMQAGSGANYSYTFTLKVTDAANNTTTQTYTFIAPAMVLDVGTWPIGSPGAGTVGATYPALVYNTPYAQPQLAYGGSGTYTSWSTPAAGNPLPPGLSVNAATGAITGTPTNTGSFSTLMQVVDDGGNTLQQFLTFNVASGTTSTINIGLGPNLGTFQSGNVNVFNINPSGGTGPYTVTALTALPPGCAIEAGSSLLSNGTGTNDLACNYLATGNFVFTLQAQDSLGNFGVKTMNVNVAPFTLFSTTALANGSVGVPYSQPLLAWDNSATITWSLAPGSAFPPGISITGSTISGTPTIASPYLFTLTATDSSGFTINFTFSLTISNIAISGPGIVAPGILTQQATIGVPFSYTFTATGGGSTKTWTASGLPGGLSIGSTTGTISGTPSSGDNPSLYRFTVTATDGSSPVTKPFALYLNAAYPTELNFNQFNTTVPDARVGQNISYTLTSNVNGGLPPYVWSVPSGSTLPPGLSLYSGASLPPNLTYGVTILAGEPTTAGAYTFDLIVTDAANTQARRTFHLNVTPISILSGGLKNATAGVAYAEQLTAAGGTGPYTFTYAPNNLFNSMFPPGITGSPAGLISGTTTSTGFYSFFATATDAANHTFTTSYGLTVTTANNLQITTGPAFGLATGQGYQVTLGTIGATNPLTWTISSGALPAGMKFSAGSISGAPTAPGPYTYNLHVVDNNGNAADRTYSGTVIPMQFPQLRSNGNSLPPAVQGQPYSYTYSVAGGTAPYNFVESPLFPLPTGMTLSAGGVLSGTPQFSGNFQLNFALSDANYSANASGGTLVVLPPGAAYPIQGDSKPFTAYAPLGVPFVANLDGGGVNGVPPITWSITAGGVPGFSLVAGNGNIPSYVVGVPTTPGSFPVTVSGTDSRGQTTSSPGTVVVGPLSMTPISELPNGIVGTPYSVQLNGVGGTPPYNFIGPTAGSDMPAGLSLNSSGLLSGTPTYPGIFSLDNVLIGDNAGNVVARSYLIVIDNAAGQAPGVSISPDHVQFVYIQGQPAQSAPITVNMTSGALSGQAAVLGIPGASLSTTTLTGANGSANLQLNLDTTSVAPGLYGGVLAVSSPGAVNLSNAIPVTLTISSLSITKTHTGNFSQGQTNATYTLTVSNANGAGPTTGTVTVTETVPSGLTLVSMAGTGWTCPGTAANNCTRSDSLAAGASYPTITVTVNVAANATSPQVNSVGVSGGASATATATDSTVVSVLAPLLSITKTHTGNFSQGQTNATYTVTVSNANGAGSTSGIVTVTETAPAGLNMLSMAGTGWTCPGTAANNCTRSDSLAGGASYPVITVTVNVSAAATSPQVNSVSVSGGGSAGANANDSTTIVAALRFIPVTPCRIVDTRKPAGAPSISGGTSRDFNIPASACSIPNTAQAYSFNVAVVPPGPLGFLTLWPAGQTRPVASTLNSLDGRIKSNAAIVPAGTGGAVSVFASNTTDVILDINGYFVPATSPNALAFYPVAPCRLVDTRKQPPAVPIGGPALVGQQSRTFAISGICNLPATAQAYSLNFAAVPLGPLGFVTAFPTGQTRPVAANLNALTGAVTANAAIVPAGANGSIDVFASNDTNLVIDVNGYFAPMNTGGLSLYGVTPCRVLDTRKPAGSPPITSLNLNVSASACGIPGTAQAYVFSVTVVPPAPLGFLTLWPQGQTRPAVSTLNAVDGVITSNMAIVPTTNGSISIFGSNPTHVVMDISGYFGQ